MADIFLNLAIERTDYIISLFLRSKSNQCGMQALIWNATWVFYTHAHNLLFQEGKRVARGNLRKRR
jgi:hypothetical protein